MASYKKAAPIIDRGRLDMLRELGTRFPSSLQKEEKKRFHTVFIIAQTVAACWTYALRLPYADTQSPMRMVDVLGGCIVG